VALEQAKREAILSAAARAFSEHGFKKTSIDEIAAAAGVGKGTVYLMCESKEDLFYQVIHREVRDVQADNARSVDPRRPADELLRQISRDGLVQMVQRPLLRALLSKEHQRFLPEWRDRFEELRALGRSVATEVLELGIRQGRFDPSMDVAQVASLLQDLHIATCLLYLSDTSSFDADLERREEAAFKLIFDGIRRRDAV
jgi:AcrR family transcriptional regulator